MHVAPSKPKWPDVYEGEGSQGLSGAEEAGCADRTTGQWFNIPVRCISFRSYGDILRETQQCGELRGEIFCPQVGNETTERPSK